MYYKNIQAIQRNTEKGGEDALQSPRKYSVSNSLTSLQGQVEAGWMDGWMDPQMDGGTDR